MLAIQQNASVFSNLEIFGEISDMKKKVTGRPPALRLTVGEVKEIAEALRLSAQNASDAAKFMEEEKLESILTKAQKVLDEHLPTIIGFTAKLYASIGPTATMIRLNRKPLLEKNQERYRKSAQKKKPRKKAEP